MYIDPELQSQLSNALELFLSPDQSIRNEVLRFFEELRMKDRLQYIVYLILHLSNPQTSIQSRTISAILIYSALHKRNLEMQRHFVPQWFKVDLSIRDQLRLSATQNLACDNENLQTQCSNLLGLFYSIELYTGCSREPINPVFNSAFSDLIVSALNSPNPQERMILYNIFSTFAVNSLELNPNCAHDNPIMSYAPKLFEVFLSGMTTNIPLLQVRALEMFSASFMIFKREFSFKRPREQLLAVVFTLTQSDNPDLYGAAYQLLRKCIDCCYNDMIDHMETIEAMTLSDMNSGNPKRQIEACFLWSTIGDVESDIQNPSKLNVKMKHREFSTNIIFSKWAFENLFQNLVFLICSTDPSETAATIQLEFTPSHAAFSCISSLTKAIDLESLNLIFEFVKVNAEQEDWRLRYASALLLNAGSQVPSFNGVKNILIAFNFFVNAIVDVIPRISEVAMWSLGRMIREIPELVTDPERFSRLCQNLSQRMDVSEELTSRACWLLNICFNVFSLDDINSPLVSNFDTFSLLLIHAADMYGVNVQDAAFGALNRLIERTPSTIADKYNNLFHIVTQKLGIILSNEQSNNNNSYDQQKVIQQVIGYLSLIQAIVMNVGSMIASISDNLMQMLTALLELHQGIYVSEVLPAMGAVARAIKQNFAKYLEALLDKVFQYLSSPEYVQPAAVFVSDIFNSFESFPDELTNKFVQALFNAFNFDEITQQAEFATISALAEIARLINQKSLPWIDNFLSLIEMESKSILSNEDENLDAESARSFAVICLQTFQTLIPILFQDPRGERKVKNLFYIFDKISKLSSIMNETVYPDAVLLIRQIAEAYQRKMNVYLNKPAVIAILTQGINSLDPKFSELSLQTLKLVRSF